MRITLDQGNQLCGGNGIAVVLPILAFCVDHAQHGPFSMHFTLQCFEFQVRCELSLTYCLLD